jgi:hypothetical protein
MPLEERNACPRKSSISSVRSSASRSSSGVLVVLVKRDSSSAMHRSFSFSVWMTCGMFMFSSSLAGIQLKPWFWVRSCELGLGASVVWVRSCELGSGCLVVWVRSCKLGFWRPVVWVRSVNRRLLCAKTFRVRRLMAIVARPHPYHPVALVPIPGSSFSALSLKGCQSGWVQADRQDVDFIGIFRSFGLVNGDLARAG